LDHLVKICWTSLGHKRTTSDNSLCNAQPSTTRQRDSLCNDEMKARLQVLELQKEMSHIHILELQKEMHVLPCSSQASQQDQPKSERAPLFNQQQMEGCAITLIFARW